MALQQSEMQVEVGGLTLAVKTWGDPALPGIIALHGWQDNAATFDRLACLFPDHYWIVPDLPGHGRSDHRGAGADYAIWSYAVEVMALAEACGLRHFVLIGHSMGGGVAGLLAAMFPERVARLVLLDILGTITTPPAQSPAQLRDAVQERIGKPLRKAGQYPSRQAAIQARANKGITAQAAALLGERGIAENGSGFYWRHDQRLARRTMLSLSDAHIAAFLQAIVCPVLLVTSRETVQHEKVIRQRAALVKDIRLAHLDGGHHQHLDGDVDAVAGLIRDFIGTG